MYFWDNLFLVLKLFLKIWIDQILTLCCCECEVAGLVTTAKLVWTLDIEPGRKVGSYCHSEAAAEADEAIKFLGMLPEVDIGLRFMLPALFKWLFWRFYFRKSWTNLIFFPYLKKIKRNNFENKVMFDLNGTNVDKSIKRLGSP